MKRTLLAVTALVFAGALAAPAFGERVAADLTLFNPAIDGHYFGTIESDDDKCAKRRSVSIYHDANGNGLDPSDFHIGDAKTNGDGEYDLKNADQAPLGDQIIAIAPKKKPKRSLTCKKAKDVAIAGTTAP